MEFETFENINYRQNHNWFEAWFDAKFDQRRLNGL